MGIFQNHLMAGAAAAASAGGASFYDYQIEQSCRFDRASSSYLYRSQPSGGSTSKYTISLWFKLGALYNYQAFMGAYNANLSYYVGTDSGSGVYSGDVWLDVQQYYSTRTNGNLSLKGVSGWTHIVVAFDLSQGTNTNKIKYYIIIIYDVRTRPTNERFK